MTLESEIERVSNLWGEWIGENGIERIKERRENVEREIERVSAQVAEDAEIDQNAKLLFSATLITAMPEYSPKAKEMLEKLLKKEPNNYQAWNLLGEQRWRQGPKFILEAKQCFERSLAANPTNQKALRSLSMILRSLPAKNEKQRNENVRLGLDRALKAIELDETDGLSWYVLGNAYLTLFIAPVDGQGSSPTNLSSSFSAYEKAASLGQVHNPDLHYNRAQLELFSEHWDKAYNSLKLSSKLDPDWPLPEEKFKNVRSFCSSVAQLCRNKGKMRPKRLKQLLEKCAAGGEESCDLLCVASLSNFDYLPFAFIGVTKESQSLLVTVYNMARGKGPIIGDIVTVPNPVQTSVSVEMDGDRFQFGSVRVDKPSLLSINHKILGAKCEINVQSTAENRL